MWLTVPREKRFALVRLCSWGVAFWLFHRTTTAEFVFWKSFGLQNCRDVRSWGMFFLFYRTVLIDQAQRSLKWSNAKKQKQMWTKKRSEAFGWILTESRWIDVSIIRLFRLLSVLRLIFLCFACFSLSPFFSITRMSRSWTCALFSTRNC